MSKKINNADNATLAGLTSNTYATAQRGVALAYFAGIRKLKLQWIMEAVNVATSKSAAELTGPAPQVAAFDIGSYIVSSLVIGGINKAKKASTPQSYYASSAGEICCERLDFIWGILKDDGVLWPAADQFNGQTYSAGSYVRFLDGNVYFTPVTTDVVPVTGGQLNEPWIYEPAPGAVTISTWEPAAWVTNSIVIFNGIIYENPGATTTNFPPAAPWIRFRRLQSELPNPFPIALASIGQSYLYWGLPNQTLDTTGGEVLLTEYGHPPYRWRPILVFQDILCGQTPTMPNFSVLGGRAPQQSIIVDDAAALDADWQANPWCIMAELITHPVIGAGLPNSIIHAASWQAEADRCAANAATTYISPLYESGKKLREIIPEILEYVDSFVFRNSSGQLQAGHWPHGEAPPAFVTANTINWDDLIEEITWDSGSWSETSDSTDLNFDDITGGFQKNFASAVNLYNRINTGRNNPRSIDRSFIVRPLQASAWATIDARTNGELLFKTTLTCRAERVTAIGPGTIFELTDDLLGVSRICRCVAKTLVKVPAGIAKLQIEAERACALIPYSATPASPSSAQKPGPELITDYQLVQIPDSLAADGNSFRIICLAARDTVQMNNYELWWNQADESGAYEELSAKNDFAIAATFYSTINGADIVNEAVTAATMQGDSFPLANPNLWNLTLQWSADGGTTWTAGVENTDYSVDYVGGNLLDLLGGAITDGSMIRVSYSIYLTFTFNAETSTDDIETITAALTTDQVNNNVLLAFGFQSANPQLFEIFSIVGFTAAGGGVYKARVVRNAYNTLSGGDGVYVFGAAAGDRIFFQFRSSLVTINNNAFANAAEMGLTANFRLVPSTPWSAGDLADVYNAGTNPAGLTTQFSYEFDNPYQPFVDWIAILADGTQISDYTLGYAITDNFEIDFALVAPAANLQSAQIIATNGTQQITLWTQAIQGGSWGGVAKFSLPVGTWTIVANILTLDGVLTTDSLTEVGSATLFSIVVGLDASTTCADPTFTIKTAHTAPYNLIITLSDLTAGASIYITNINFNPAAPALPWTTGTLITGPLSCVPSKFVRRFWMQAQKSGLTSSNLVQVLIPGS